MKNIPEKIGRYEIIEPIGRGSMGVVYCAHDPFSNRLVALKVAHVQRADDDEHGNLLRKAFFNEAHAASVLDHPNILEVYDADSDGELYYLVMEYIHGATTLQGFCKPEGLLPLRRVVGYIYKVAKALDYAHRQGIVHRDIKPSNFLLTEDNDIKLADFSVAMISRSDAATTQFVGIVGSPLYMSPEQIFDEPLSGTSDIFSLGTVSYMLLTGIHPFRAANLGAINQRIASEEPPPISDFRRAVPRGLVYVVQQMLKKDPADRYPTGLDLAADLASVFEDLETTDDEDDLKERFTTIRGLGFFRGFTDSDIWELARACQWERYPAGVDIISEGEEDHSFYIVLSGVVSVNKRGNALYNLQEGDCFGEMGYLSKARRSATVTTKTEVSVIKVNEASIDRAAEPTQLRFHKVFVRTLIERLKATTELVGETTSRTP